MSISSEEQNALFSSNRVLANFIVLVMCAQFAFSVLAMRSALLPQMLELWEISKTQFGLLMSIYGIVHNVLYLLLSWAQDRFSSRVLIPVNMVLGGITTFFLGKTTDFATLCFLFVMLALWCEGAFWPAVLSAVRKSTSDRNQGKIFGIFEGGRGIVELVQNAGTVALYAALGYSLFGLELAFMINAGIMIALGVVSWFMLPRETLLKSGNDRSTANAEVTAGMRVTLRLPEVWLAGLMGFTVYLAYSTLPFYLTLLNEEYALPILAVSLFGIISTSGGRIGIAFPAGFIADRFFGGPSRGIRAGLVAVTFLALGMWVVPHDPSASGLAMALMMCLACCFYFMRSLYFAPFGEMGLPPRFSGSVIAFASFFIYLPTTFAYALWGWLIDSYPDGDGYRMVFGLLTCFAIGGVVVASLLIRRLRSGTSRKIARAVAERVDQQLGLEGEERTMTGQFDR